MKHFLVLCGLAGSLCAQQQNLKENYAPLASKGPLPELFTAQLRPMAQKDIAALKLLDKAASPEGLLYSYAGIETFVKSGNILVNDEVSAYLERIADVLLKNQPELRKSIHIYAYKSTVVNAHSFNQGCIFINTGMVAQAETEAQLAYVLAREIAHYTKKHVLGRRGQPLTLIDDAYDYGKNIDATLAELYAYSPADEADADTEGYRLYKQGNYSLKQAEKVFDLLQYSHLPFELVEFKRTIFETEHYKLPDAYFLKEVSPIASKSNTDDMEALHPNINKRKMAINSLVTADNNSGRSSYVVGEANFKYVRDLARFELCRLYLKSRDHANALYTAYVLQQQYPDNEYLVEVIAKCTYGITLYRNGSLNYYFNSALPSGYADYKDIEAYPQQVYHLVQTMPPNEWVMLALNYSYRAHKRFPGNKALAVISDSLFSLMARTDWGIADFVRTNVKEEAAAGDNSEPKSKTELIANIQKEKNQRHLDTMYYKDVYTDLFMSDAEFAKKFPAPALTVVNYKAPETKPAKATPVFLKIDTVLLVAPFHYYVGRNGGNEEVQNKLDPKNEDLAKSCRATADKMKYSLMAIDPETLGSSEADRWNDHSLLCDWMFEMMDDNKLDNLVLNTDGMKQLAEKYKTPYVLKLGFVALHGRKGEIACYTFIYDLRKDRLVYGRSEKVPYSDEKATVASKIYQVLGELKYHKLQAN